MAIFKSREEKLAEQAAKEYRNGKFIKAFEAYKQLARWGVAEAMFRIAHMYREGEGTEENQKEASHWYEKAAEFGHVEAMLQIGVRCMCGQAGDVDGDMQKAQFWLEKAKDGGNKKAAEILIGIDKTNEPVKNMEPVKTAAPQTKQEDAAVQWSAEEWFNKGEEYYNAERYEEALEPMRKAANAGHPEAQYTVGLLYDKGRGVAQDYKQAALWYEKAAENGYVKAMNSIGSMYQYGDGVTQDFQKAVLWFTKAAENGHVKAMNNLGNRYQNGEGTAQDYQKAVYWYAKSAELDNSTAMFNLAIMYENGKGTARDFAKAREWYEKAQAAGNKDAATALDNLDKAEANAERNDLLRHATEHYNAGSYAEAMDGFKKAATLGDFTAMYNAGIMYENGDGVAMDMVQAREWFIKAQAAGCKEAEAKLEKLGKAEADAKPVLPQQQATEWVEKGAEHYEAKHYAEAITCFKKAAALGDSDAMLNIGTMYTNGKGVTADYAKAREWYKKAAENGNVEAQYRIGYLYATGTGVTKDMEIALFWFVKAAVQNHAPAQYSLGDIYFGSGGLEKDETKASQWYLKSAENGYDRAQYKIGLCYHLGTGVPKDSNKALYWLEKAAKQGYSDAFKIYVQLKR